ncbi:hypothetical protein KC887_07575 [Candidatus Kaiserbacteria bacterium]|nr:hypothetical protein [Candidatus Kaiserbacteria bacterium]
MSFEVESILISHLLGDPSKIELCDLQPGQFLDAAHAMIYRTVADVYEKTAHTDLFTIAEHIERKTGQSGWTANLMQRVNTVPVNDVENLCEMIKKDFICFQARKILADYSESLQDRDALNQLDGVISELMALNTDTEHHMRRSNAVALEALDVVEERFMLDGKTVGLPTGLRDLDKAMGGWHDSFLIVIGARPAMGKTAFLLNTAQASGETVGFISAEQPAHELEMRYFSINGCIDLRKIQTGNLDSEDGDWGKLTSAVSLSKAREIIYYDKPGMTITDVLRAARQMHHKHRIKGLFVDYLQEINPDNPSQPRHEQIRDITGKLKALAKQLKIPVVTLAQVNRNVDQRSDKRPTMSDLSDSSEIEKKADEVITLYRDDYYNPESPSKGLVDIWICKNRHGPTGLIRAVWRGKFLQFKDLEIRQASGGDF